MTKIALGDKAPDFALKNQEGQDISLADFKGKKTVVLYFYPKAMTPGCTVQACGLTGAKEKLSAQDAVPLGISPDSPERLAKFIQRDNLNFDLLSDPDHRVASLYGVWGKKKFMGREFMGILRTSFIVGKDGCIHHIMDKVNTKTHHLDVLKIITNL